MKITTKIMLCLMMFFNFFIWGSWFVTMGDYLGSIGASGAQIGLAYSTQGLGAIVAPFIIGLIADKFISAQKLLAVIHLIGGVILYILVKFDTVENFNIFFGLLLTYMVLFMPTLTLTNAIALKQIQNSEKEFSFIRMWGTIGWIVQAQILVGVIWFFWGKDVNINKIDYKYTFLIAHFVSIVFGIYCFFLPKTPPPNKDKKTTLSDILGLKSLSLLKDKNYALFFIASILICIPLAFYYSFAGRFLGELKVQNFPSKMGYGQIAEMLFLLIMPWFFTKLGVKKMLLLGMLAWAVRYIFFGYGDIDSKMWMLYGGIILHGICYDFFFVTGYIYTDQVAGEKIRASAQGLITIATYGIGMLIGFSLSGKIVDNYQYKELVDNVEVVKHHWNKIWQFPASFSLVIFLLFSIMFKPSKIEKQVN